MKLKRIYAIFLRQYYLFRGNASRWVLMLFWETADLIIWGFLTIYLNKVGGAQFNFITVLIGAIIFYNLMTRAQNGVSVTSMEDVWAKNFLNIFSTPLSIGEYVLGLMLISAVTTIISVAFMGILAQLFFHYALLQFGWLIIPYVAVLFIFGAALGLIGISVVIRFGPSAETFIWIIVAAISPFSGVFYPISTLPRLLQIVARIIPASYIFEGMRSLVLNGVFDIQSLIVGFLLSLVCIFVAYGILVYYYRQAIKRGLFARFLSDAW